MTNATSGFRVASRSRFPLLRVEVALQSDVGVTLRDVHRPADVFFQYAGKSLVAVLDGFSGWESHAEGFVLPPRPERTAYERFHAFVSGSVSCAVPRKWRLMSMVRMSLRRF